jgi:hypothetical protein
VGFETFGVWFFLPSPVASAVTRAAGFFTIMLNIPQTERVDYMDGKILPVRLVSVDEFRARATAAGHKPKAIELFCLPPFTPKCRFVVNKEILKIIPFDAPAQLPSNPMRRESDGPRQLVAD